MMFIDPNFRTPNKEAAKYTEAELRDFKSAFAAQEKNRPGWWARASLFSVLSFFGGAAAGLLLGKWVKIEALFPIGGIAGALGGFYFTFRLMQRRCPACEYDIEGDVGRYCPCCGSKSLNHLFNHPRCEECGVVLKWNRSQIGQCRMFHVRFCSVCGVKLSDAGVDPALC